MFITQQHYIMTSTFSTNIDFFDKNTVTIVPLIHKIKRLPSVIIEIIIDFCLDNLVIGDISRSSTYCEYYKSIINAQRYIKNHPITSPTVITSRLIFIVTHKYNIVFKNHEDSKKMLLSSKPIDQLHKSSHLPYSYTHQLCDLDNGNNALTLKNLENAIHDHIYLIHPKTANAYFDCIMITAYNPFEQLIHFTLPEQQEFLEWQREQGLR